MSNSTNPEINFSKQDGVSLKEYIDDRLCNLEKSIDMRFENVMTMTNAALAAADKATSKAETTANERFNKTNEFRETLADQQRTLMPRSEAELMIRSINEKVDALNLTTISGQSRDKGVSQGWSWAVLAIGLIATVVGIILAFR
jgi:hypothetical protein